MSSRLERVLTPALGADRARVVSTISAGIEVMLQQNPITASLEADEVFPALMATAGRIRRLVSDTLAEPEYAERSRVMLETLDTIYLVAQADDPNPPKSPSMGDIFGLSDVELVKLAGGDRFVAPEDRGDIR